jgi:hypothetical protein
VTARAESKYVEHKQELEELCEWTFVLLVVFAVVALSWSAAPIAAVAVATCIIFNTLL